MNTKLTQRPFVNLVYLSVLVAVFLLINACTPAKDESVIQDIVMQGHTMGTTYSIKLVSSEQALKEQNLYSEVSALLDDINQKMSTYIDDSELSKFNQMKSTEPVSVSSELKFVIDEALRIGVLSQGRLDVTVGPLVNLWGFGPNKRATQIPSDDEIAITKAKIGLDKLFSQGNLIGKTHPDLYVDLSTIAKGYAVDRIAALLESKGLTNYMVEIGGETRISGKKNDSSDWRIAIEKPVSHERAVQKIIAPGNNAIATSGDYRNYHEFDGKRYSHIIDPTTGKPINHNLVSVTVITPNCITADAMATAIMVMGTADGFDFALRNNIAVYMVSKTDEGFAEHITPEFNPYIVQ